MGESELVGRLTLPKDVLVQADADLKKPIDTKIVTDTYFERSPEGILELRVAPCPFYSGFRDDGCNHCALPTFSAGGPVTSEQVMQQIDSGLTALLEQPQGKEMRVLSMFNGGSGLNAAEVPREALFYLFDKAKQYHQNGKLANLKKISVEAREVYVDAQLVIDLVEKSHPLKFEVSLGYESHDPAVRNGDRDNSNSRIGLNKKINQARFETAIETLANFGAEAKVYVMMGAVPWIEPVEDTVKTVEYLDLLSQKVGMPIAIHLNPTYSAVNTPLRAVWDEAYEEGRSLPTYWQLIEALSRIHSTVKPIGSESGQLKIYLGLNPEGLDERKFGNNCDDCNPTVEKALIDFSRTQQIAPLLKLDCYTCKRFDYEQER